jgi:RND family efflux transporter MFP subunit
MRFRLRLGASVLGLGLLSACAGCAGQGGETPVAASTTPRVVPVTVASPVRRPVERTVDVVGTLKGWEDVTIGAKLAAMRVARVVKVLHDMGDRIQPGELLIEIDPIDADLAVKQAERQLQVELAKLGLKEIPQDDFDVTSVPTVVQARVTLERAGQYLQRERSLMRRGAGTTQDLQNTENDEKAAEAALANAILTARSTLANAFASRAALDVARQARIDMEVRAPVPSKTPTGITHPITYALTKRQVAEGQMLKQGDPVAELVIENPLRLRANVPERFSTEVRLGQPVRIAVAAHAGTIFEGTVARINPAVDPVSRTFQVETTVPNNRGLLRPGGFAKASILTDRNDQALTVPIEAIVRYAGVTKLFVVAGAKAQSINVATRREGPGWIEVIGPVPPGAQVVVTGQTQLANDTPVAVRR